MFEANAEGVCARGAPNQTVLIISTKPMAGANINKSSDQPVSFPTAKSSPEPITIQTSLEYSAGRFASH